MTGDSKPGDAVADQSRDEFDKNRLERDLAIERLAVRATMKSENEVEDTSVINIRAAENITARTPSSPPSKTGIFTAAFTFANGFPAWGKVIVAVVAIVAYAVLKLAGALPGK